MKDRRARLEFVPPVDPATGFVPYLVRARLSKTPLLGYSVFMFSDKGLPEITMFWDPIEGNRLRLSRLHVKRFDVNEWTLPMARGYDDYDLWFSYHIDEEGHADVSIVEQKNGFSQGRVTGEQMFNRELLFRGAPAWGHWDDLLQDPPTPR